MQTQGEITTPPAPREPDADTAAELAKANEYLNGLLQEDFLLHEEVLRQAAQERLEGEQRAALGRNRGNTGVSTVYTFTRNAQEAPPAFPTEVLPPELQALVEEGAAAMGCPVDFVAVPLLGFLAAAVGGGRRIRVKRGWEEPAILWLAVVGEPGTGKTPALEEAKRPLLALQDSAWGKYRMEEAAWLEAGQEGERPALDHLLTTDATIEALAVMCQHSAGLAVVRDELVGWVKGFDAYRQAGDRQQWLGLWSAHALKIDCKGSGTVYVPAPTVSVVGGVQPDVLRDLAGDAARRDGFLDRFLFTWPEPEPSGWSDDELDPATQDAAKQVFLRVRASSARIGTEPHVAELTPEAKAAFVAFYKDNALALRRAGGAAGHLAKAPGQVARLALVLHAAWHPEHPTDPVEVATMRDAIALLDYFQAHLARVLPALGLHAAGWGGLAGKVRRSLERAGAEGLKRDALMRALGGHVPATELTAALDALAEAGEAERVPPPPGKPGRPAELWRLRVNVETVETPVTQEVA